MKKDSNDTAEFKKKIIPKALRKKNYNKILAVSITAVVLGVGVTAYMLQVSKAQKVEKHQRIRYNYTNFINNWNTQVQNKTDKKQFLLDRDSNEEMIKQLNKFMGQFYIPDISESIEYNNYLQNNKTEELITFNSSMDSAKIKKGLQKATRENAISDITKKILMMNSYEFYEKNKN